MSWLLTYEALIVNLDYKDETKLSQIFQNIMIS